MATADTRSSTSRNYRYESSRKKILGGTEYPYRVSVWYTDVIESIDYDPDGVAVFIDKYLDVIFTPYGDIKMDDSSSEFIVLFYLYRSIFSEKNHSYLLWIKLTRKKP